MNKDIPRKKSPQAQPALEKLKIDFGLGEVSFEGTSKDLLKVQVEELRKTRLFSVLYAVALVLLGVGLAHIKYPAVDVNKLLMWLFSGDIVPSLIGCVAFLGSGFWLFKFRDWKPALYGITEVIVAVYGGFTWFTKNTQIEKLDVFAAFAVVYIIVRGLDNCDRGGLFGRNKVNKDDELAALEKEKLLMELGDKTSKMEEEISDLEDVIKKLNDRIHAKAEPAQDYAYVATSNRRPGESFRKIPGEPEFNTLSRGWEYMQTTLLTSPEVKSVVKLLKPYRYIEGTFVVQGKLKELKQQLGAGVEVPIQVLQGILHILTDMHFQLKVEVV